MRNTYSLEIDAPPARVFCWLDDAERVMQWAENVVENEDLVTTAEKVGSTFRQVYSENGRRMEFEGRCVAWEADRKLGIAMEGSMFGLDVLYTLDDLGGRTRLTQESRVRWKGLMKLLGPVMALFMRKAGDECVAKDHARLKQLAESTPDEAA